jgi:hypothetical protein
LHKPGTIGTFNRNGWNERPDSLEKMVRNTHAIRQLQGKPETEPLIPVRRGRRRQSLVDLSVKILTEEGKPLHVNEIVRLLQVRFGRLADRDTLSSALAKKARRGILLRQSAPATFTLIDPKEDNHEKT